MHTTQTPAYRQAFIQYLRKGIAIAQSLKAAQERPTTQYIWRTRGDNKVRASHAANNGRIFMWDNPPETGHPGEDYGCRCWAEAYVPEVDELVSQIVTSTVDEGLYRWKWYEFVLWYYFGGGKSLRLSEVQHLQDVIDISHGHVFKRVELQIINEARATLSGNLNDEFVRSYPYDAVTFIHGDSTVRGSYNGSVKRIGNALHIHAEVIYHFSDTFTDPFDIRERNGGTSDPAAIPANELIDSEIGGQFYDIYDSWTTRLTAIIHIDANKSGYRY